MYGINGRSRKLLDLLGLTAQVEAMGMDMSGQSMSRVQPDGSVKLSSLPTSNDKNNVRCCNLPGMPFQFVDTWLLLTRHCSNLRRCGMAMLSLACA